MGIFRKKIKINTLAEIEKYLPTLCPSPETASESKARQKFQITLKGEEESFEIKNFVETSKSSFEIKSKDELAYEIVKYAVLQVESVIPLQKPDSSETFIPIKERIENFAETTGSVSYEFIRTFAATYKTKAIFSIDRTKIFGYPKNFLGDKQPNPNQDPMTPASDLPPGNQRDLTPPQGRQR